MLGGVPLGKSTLVIEAIADTSPFISQDPTNYGIETGYYGEREIVVTGGVNTYTVNMDYGAIVACRSGEYSGIVDANGRFKHTDAPIGARPLADGDFLILRQGNKPSEQRNFSSRLRSLTADGYAFQGYYISDANYSPLAQFSAPKSSESSYGQQDYTYSLLSGWTINSGVTKTLTDISVTPSKTKYKVGESVSTSDMTVTAIYSNGSQKVVDAGYTVEQPTAAFTKAGKITVTISYTEDGVTKTEDYDVTVSSVGSYDNITGSIKMNGIVCQKTSEKEVINATVTVSHSSDNYSSYYQGTESAYMGVFNSIGSTTIQPFLMGMFEVTQQLYEAVMGTNPSDFKNDAVSGEKQELRPVETVSWYDAVAFCNALTEALDLKDANYNIDYAYYTDASFTKEYTADDAADQVTPYMKTIGDSKGYRLPTEAEWEFAARGGDTSKPEWKYAFAGKQVKSGTASDLSYLRVDDNLATVGWYGGDSSIGGNSGGKTHEVGKKQANNTTLGLYDMSGNVCEWCWDKSNTSDKRIYRGGNWFGQAGYCSVSYRTFVLPDYKSRTTGFRVVRSQ